MRKVILAIAMLLIVQKNYAQEKYALGFSFGLGKNYFDNTYNTDENHFNYKSPFSIGFGAQIVKYVNPKNEVVLKFGYTSQKIKFVYKTNERDIPYAVEETTIDKFNSLSLSIGYRRPFTIHQYKVFAEIDFRCRIQPKCGARCNWNREQHRNRQYFISRACFI